MISLHLGIRKTISEIVIIFRTYNQHTMKSIFDTSTKEELIRRINSLNPQSKAQWGKMNVCQMIRHAALGDKMLQGELKIKRVLIGRLFGRMILKQVMKDDAPFRKNSPTSPQLQTPAESRDIEAYKKEWINRIGQYNNNDTQGINHPFFGAMTGEQIGMFAYKHADHHLRQFGA
jgi:hypothetical protein